MSPNLVRDQFCRFCSAPLVCPTCGDRDYSFLDQHICKHCNTENQFGRHCGNCGKPMPAACILCQGTGRIPHVCSGRTNVATSAPDQTKAQGRPKMDVTGLPINVDFPSKLGEPWEHGRLGSIKPLGTLSGQEPLGKFPVEPIRPLWENQGIKAPFVQPDSFAAGASGRSSSTSSGGCTGAVVILVALLALVYVLWPWLQRMGLF